MCWIRRRRREKKGSGAHSVHGWLHGMAKRDQRQVIPGSEWCVNQAKVGGPREREAAKAVALPLC